jgi:hypothetical protein
MEIDDKDTAASFNEPTPGGAVAFALTGHGFSRADKTG